MTEPDEAEDRVAGHGSLDRELPIGVFDSGIGGLTVVRELLRALPRERIVYLGDTARVPYGTRSANTIVRYARGCARTLAADGIKALVVACNTVSAVALDILRVELDLPVLGVVEPGARAAVAVTRGRVGVIGTASTVGSGAYPRAIAACDTRCEVFTQAAPLLVPLAEEGWTDGDVPRLAARRYLAPLAAADIDTLVLGCTHYPLLRTVLETESAYLAARAVHVVDSGQAVAIEVARFLAERELLAARDPLAPEAALRLLVTDLPGRFSEAAARFLGDAAPVAHAEQIDLPSG
ncbi:MAG: glutamate racemase [Deltaproteobacteria bacterium]|nr:glutamate racemase [Deltaproteobacteria bacterium]